MDQIRKLLQSPAIGWSVAAIAVGFAIFMLIRSFFAVSPYDPARLTQDVTIRFTDTGEEVTMSRGRLEKELRGSGKALNPDEGLLNPKTGKLTGFLVATNEWKETIARLNQERQEAQARSPWGAPPSGPAKASGSR
ncbi:MAG: hypothetical protein KF805_16160 [Phycisphaeraceae bacterium]|nr:hypothetical protein [Phycisphaeraceae bacterium]